MVLATGSPWSIPAASLEHPWIQAPSPLPDAPLVGDL